MCLRGPSRLFQYHCYVVGTRLVQHCNVDWLSSARNTCCTPWNLRIHVCLKIAFYITNSSHIIIPILLLLLLGRILPKSLSLRHLKSYPDEIWQKCTSCKYTSIDGIFDLMSYVQDGGLDVISHRKVMPSGECAHSVNPVHMQLRPPVTLIVVCEITTRLTNVR